MKNRLPIMGGFALFVASTVASIGMAAAGSQVAYAAEGISCADLQGAINDAAAGATITLADETCAADITVPAGKNITLDLAGHTLSQATNNKDTLTIAFGGSATVTGGTVTNTGSGAAIYNQGTAVINGAVVTKPDNATFYNILNHGTMTINDAALTRGNARASSIHNGYYDYLNTKNRNGYREGQGLANPVLTINGGSYVGGTHAVKNGGGGILTINGGSFVATGTPNNSYNAIQNWHHATINGGDFTALDGYTSTVVANGADSDEGYEGTGDGVLKITGGTFTGKYIIQNHFEAPSNGHTTSPVQITGGVFNYAETFSRVDIADMLQISGGNYNHDPVETDSAQLKTSNSILAANYHVTKLSDSNFGIIHKDNIVVGAPTTLKVGASGDVTVQPEYLAAGATITTTTPEIVKVEGSKVTALKTGEAVIKVAVANLNPSYSTELKVKVYQVAANTESDSRNAALADVIAAAVANGTAKGIDANTAGLIKDAVLAGENIKVGLSTDYAYNATDDEKQLVASVLDQQQLAGYLDIDLVISTASGRNLGTITELDDKMPIVVKLSQLDLPAVAKGYKRTYQVVRLHNGVPTILDTTDNGDGTITFETDAFSTYAVVYLDVEDPDYEAEIEVDTEVDTPNTASATTTQNPNTATGANVGRMVAIAIIAVDVIAGLAIAIRHLVKA